MLESNFLNYFRSVHGNRILFGSCEITKITLPSRGGALIHTVHGSVYEVASRFPEFVVKEPPHITGPNAPYQFRRYEKLVED